MNEEEKIIKLLSRLIQKNLSQIAVEEHGPKYGPDESDDFIKRHRNKAKRLREIRSELEELFTGVKL